MIFSKAADLLQSQVFEPVARVVSSTQTFLIWLAKPFRETYRNSISKDCFTLRQEIFIKLFNRKTTHLFACLLVTPLLWLQLPGESRVLTHGAAAIAHSNSHSDSSAQRQETAESFLDLLFSQQYEAATQYISPIVKNEFPADVLRQKVETFQRGAGAFVTRLDSQVEDDIVVVNLRFEQGERTFIVSFDENLNILNVNYVFELMLLPHGKLNS